MKRALIGLSIIAPLLLAACVHQVSLTCERDPATGIVTCDAGGSAGPTA